MKSVKTFTLENSGRNLTLSKIKGTEIMLSVSRNDPSGNFAFDGIWVNELDAEKIVSFLKECYPKISIEKNKS